MAEELAELQARRAALSAAIHAGALRVEDQFGRSVFYRSLAEMRSILAGLDAQIAPQIGTPTPSFNRRRNYVISTKGL